MANKFLGVLATRLRWVSFLPKIGCQRPNSYSLRTAAQYQQTRSSPSKWKSRTSRRETSSTHSRIIILHLSSWMIRVLLRDTLMSSSNRYLRLTRRKFWIRKRSRFSRGSTMLPKEKCSPPRSRMDCLLGHIGCRLSILRRIINLFWARLLNTALWMMLYMYVTLSYLLDQLMLTRI